MHLSIPVLLTIGLAIAQASPLNYVYAQEPVRRTRQLDSLLKLHGERPENYDFKLPRQYYYFDESAGFPKSAFGPGAGGPGGYGPRGPGGFGPRGPGGFGPVGSSFSKFSGSGFRRPDAHYAVDDRLSVHDPQANSLLGVIA